MSGERAAGESEAAPPPRRRAVIGTLLRVAITTAALAWTLSRVSLDDLSRAGERVTAGAAALALALTFGNLLLGATRWRILLRAYGAERPPPIARLYRVNLVGLFFNTFLPANVAGDVVRAHVTRDAFDGAASAYVIVAIERIFGLAGLLVLATTVLLVHPLEPVADLPWVAALGLVAAVLAALSPVLARRFAHRLPGKLSELAAALPSVRHPWLLFFVLAISVGTHLVLAITGHVLLVAIDPDVSLAESIVIVPIALAALYFPTIAGLGAREAAYVVLFGTIGVAAADATAASLALFGVQLLVAATGGMVHVAGR